MFDTRLESINRILLDIENFKIDLIFYEDSEPRGVINTLLSGKLDTLAAYCKVLGWSELSEELIRSLPIQATAVETLELVQGYVVPEIRRLIEKTDVDSEPTPTDWFWDFIHPRICALARPRFDAGFFGDAVEASFKEINDSVKRLHLQKTGNEADGSGLMTSAFSARNPSIKLTDLVSETDRSIQQGYMQIFSGAMTGIRNPKAHSNLNPDSRKALHLRCDTWRAMRHSERSITSPR